MSKAIVVNKPGGPEVLRMKEVPLRPLGPNDVLVRHTAIGINYIDVYQRTGLYSMDANGVPGVEAVGVVEAVGEKVEGFTVGSRVGYATTPYGAYCDKRVVHHKYLVAIPNYINDEVAAASLMKGMTAHYLLFRTFTVTNQHTIIIHAAAGGVGQFLCRWAKHIGAKVIATVGSEAKVQVAQSCGADHVICLAKQNLVDEVEKITHGDGVVVVYDGIGKDTYKQSLECLMPLGLFVSYGQSSGPIENFDMSLLSRNSLYMTRPSIFVYKSHRAELVLSANEVFLMIQKGVLKPVINKKYRFTEADIQQAHIDLEGRKGMGSNIIVF